MAEYIIDEEDLALVEPPIDPEHDYEYPERIVRCRNCKFYNYAEKVCDRFGEYPSAVGIWFAAGHNGFCEWGERLEGE